MTHSAAIDGIQAFLGTLDGSPNLPSISGTPILKTVTVIDATDKAVLPGLLGTIRSLFLNFGTSILAGSLTLGLMTLPV